MNFRASPKPSYLENPHSIGRPPRRQTDGRTEQVMQTTADHVTTFECETQLRQSHCESLQTLSDAFKNTHSDCNVVIMKRSFSLDSSMSRSIMRLLYENRFVDMISVLRRVVPNALILALFGACEIKLEYKRVKCRFISSKH